MDAVNAKHLTHFLNTKIQPHSLQLTKLALFRLMGTDTHLLLRSAMIDCVWGSSSVGNKTSFFAIIKWVRAPWLRMDLVNLVDF